MKTTSSKCATWAPALVALQLWGCGSGSPEPRPAPSGNVQCPIGQTFDGQYCVADVSQPPPQKQPVDERPPAPAATTSEVVPAPTGTASPGPAPTTTTSTTPVPPAPGRDFAAPVDVTMAAAAAPLIQYLAAAHLPAGARPFGAPFAGQFAEGQVLEQRVQLTPGKCYTVVAAGTPPVEELDIVLYTVAQGPLGREETPLATDADRGPQAVLGRKTECFRPVAGKTELVLVLRVTKGRGVGAAQVFEK